MANCQQCGKPELFNVSGGVFCLYCEINPSMTFNNIQVSNNSSVGAINTGQAHAIDAAITLIHEKIDPNLSTAIKQFTQAVIDSNEINAETRAELIEQISFLTSQIMMKPEEKKKSISRTILKGIETTVSTVSKLASLWQLMKPLLEPYFNV